MSEAEVKKCSGACKRWRPLADFFPSTHSQKTAVCRACASAARMDQLMERNVMLAKQIRDVFGMDAEWTSKEVAAALKRSNLGMGSVVASLVRAGMVAQVRQGVYKLATVERSVTPKSNAAATPKDAPIDIAAQPAPTLPSHWFLSVGPYYFGVRNIACIEVDDRGRVSIMLNVQETRADGHVAPVSFEFADGEAQHVINSLAIMHGQTPKYITEQIATLKEQCARASADRDAAMNLATELEAKLAKIRSQFQ